MGDGAAFGLAVVDAAGVRLAWHGAAARRGGGGTSEFGVGGLSGRHDGSWQRL